MVRTIALIPARGGSKGVHRKNLELVGGISLLERSIRHALAVSAVDAVYVSTEDPEIAEASRACGASVISRPLAIAGDMASTEVAIEHAIEVLSAAGEPPDVIVLLQCTSPFRSEGQLQAALERFETSGCDSLLSVARFHGFLWSAAAIGGGYRPRNYDPARRPRRQDMDDAYRETGSFYIFRRALFESVHARVGGRVEIFEVPGPDAVDIDTREDLELVRRLAETRDESCPPAEVAHLRWLILDVDGVLTDGASYRDEAGRELRRFDTRDRFGIQRWREAGGRVALLTSETSEAAQRWAGRLEVDQWLCSCADKGAALRTLKQHHGLEKEQLVAMGDDLDDLAMAPEVAIFAAPADAQTPVRARADALTVHPGGHGAVRELIEELLDAGALRRTSPTSSRGPTGLASEAGRSRAA